MNACHIGEQMTDVIDYNLANPKINVTDVTLVLIDESSQDS